nr:beta-eliminating lyase-related protein [Prolixibacteraceae bacterium]
KNGMMMGEAVLFFNSELSKNTKYIRKQSAQLFSKMRFVAAQFLAYFENELWDKNARHANQMASILAEKAEKIGVRVTQEVKANGVFAVLDNNISRELQKKYFFYPWDENNNEVRWMTSFDTTEEDINNFSLKLQELLNA